MQIRSALSANPFVMALPEAAQAAWMGAARIRKYPADTPLFREGDAANGYFGLLSGEVRFSKVTRDGRQSTLAVIGPPRWFGELSFLDGQPRMHDAHSTCDVTLAVIPAPEMPRLLAAHDAIRAGLVAQLARHTRLLYAAVDDLLLMSPERLMAKKLIERAGPGSAGHRGPLTVKLSQEGLAALVGISRQSVNRTLRIWEGKGYVIRDYGKIIVIRPEPLRALFLGAD